MVSVTHNKNKLYNTLLFLSRNIYFYEKIKLPDTFQTRIYLMFIHFSIFMIISKKKSSKFDQRSYDFLFNNIEYNLREQGLGDVSVNKKMKDFNKILYDILLKIDLEKNSNKFKVNPVLILSYFNTLKNEDKSKLDDFIGYFTNFFNFCFELSLDNMIEDALKYKY